MRPATRCFYNLRLDYKPAAAFLLLVLPLMAIGAIASYAYIKSA